MTELEQPAAPDKVRRRTGITEDQQVQILDAYTTTDESVKDISARFGIRDTYIYNVLDRVGVSWRRGNPETFATWQERQRAVPEPVEKALENMLRLPVLPPKPEPVAPTPAIERRMRSTEIERWAITVQGLLLIEASDLEDAIAQVRRTQPGLRIMKVELSQ